jgi:hypothetical protein
MTEPSEETLAKVEKARLRYDDACMRSYQGSLALKQLAERIPQLGPELGELDLLRHKGSAKKQRELAEDFMECAQALLQITNLTEPIVDHLLEEARKIGRP